MPSVKCQASRISIVQVGRVPKVPPYTPAPLRSPLSASPRSPLLPPPSSLSCTPTPLRSPLPTPHSPLPAFLTLALLLYFWTIGLANLDRFPKIHEDESWQAAPGYTFWSEGRFGTDLFAGFYGMEEHYYGFMPLFPILVGAALHLFGLGLFQARLVPLMLITLTLALTHRLGSKLFSPWHGTIAVAILAGWRIAGPFTHLVSGIPMADVARITRYDSAVPVFGLVALLLLVVKLCQSPQKIEISGLEIRDSISNLQSSISGLFSPFIPSTMLRASLHPSSFIPHPSSFILAGGLAGLATLSHLYGAFWLPALIVALFWLVGWRQMLKPALLMIIGFGLMLAPWLLFVASGWDDFLNQYRNYSNRFGLLDLRFYLINLLMEVERYDPILNGAKQSFGAWLWLIICSLSLGWLLYRAVWQRDRAAKILIASVVTLGTLFALLLSLKTFSYLATLWPIFALIIAAGLMRAWQIPTRHRWWRPVLILLVCAAWFEGGLTTWRVHQAARHMTAYQTYTQRLAEVLPPGSRVLGLQHYWLGLADESQSYRSILVPIFWTNPAYVSEPISFGQAAQAIPPDIVLLDPIMLDFLAEVAPSDAPFHSLGVEIWAYLEQQHARLIAEIDDPTYGLTQIYRLEAANP